jgi:hypothetical protein
MKEIIVVEPDDCPFREYHEDGHECNISGIWCGFSDRFPPDCPLFENDYLIRRRIENGRAG